MEKNSKFGGLIIGILTFFMWGFFPMYFKMLDGVGAGEILAHRIIWSVIFLSIILAFTHRLKNIKRIFFFEPKILFGLMISGALIATNWGVYIWAINQGKILESSLGYFINPLMSVLLGALILKERLNFVAKISIFIVFCAVCVQIFALGTLPFISLVLPTSFALYGLVKKKIIVGAMEGLFVETLVLSGVALIFVCNLQAQGTGHFAPNLNGFLLLFSGVITILPLITFNIATRKLSLGTLGLLQYISPTIQALIAAFYYGENLDWYKIASFCLIWFGILLVSIDGILRAKS